MITAEDCSPTSEHYNGLPWMTDIQSQIDQGIIKSAKHIRETETASNLEEDQATFFELGFKK